MLHTNCSVLFAHSSYVCLLDLNRMITYVEGYIGGLVTALVIFLIYIGVIHG